MQPPRSPDRIRRARYDGETMGRSRTWIGFVTAALVLAASVAFMYRQHDDACTHWQKAYRIIVSGTQRELYYGVVTKGPFGSVGKHRPPGCPIPTD